MNRQRDLAFQVLGHLIAAREDMRRLTEELKSVEQDVREVILRADIGYTIESAEATIYRLALALDTAWDGVDPETSESHRAAAKTVAAMHLGEQPTREQIRDDRIERAQ